MGPQIFDAADGSCEEDFRLLLLQLLTFAEERIYMIQLLLENLR